jgi:hypothetical protein
LLYRKLFPIPDSPSSPTPEKIRIIKKLYGCHDDGETIYPRQYLKYAALPFHENNVHKAELGAHLLCISLLPVDDDARFCAILNERLFLALDELDFKIGREYDLDDD